METETIVKSGKYKFRIIDKIVKYEDRIIGRNLHLCTFKSPTCRQFMGAKVGSLCTFEMCKSVKIGGNYPDCVNISISYSGDIPVSAYIPILVYNEECSMETPLDRGGGSIIMIKELLTYVKQKIPEIKNINFEDLSQIDCANIEEIEKYKGIKKIGTHIKPIPLYFFSIMFNGKTWYEKNFNARLKQDKAHKAYREKVEHVLTMKLPEFENFLQIINPPLQIIPKLKTYYESNTTYGNFFRAIPVSERCELVRDWITPFMHYYIGDVFTNTNWIIPIQSFAGGRKRTKKNNSQRNTSNKSKYRILRYNNDIGVDAKDV